MSSVVVTFFFSSDRQGSSDGNQKSEQTKHHCEVTHTDPCFSKEKTLKKATNYFLYSTFSLDTPVCSFKELYLFISAVKNNIK